MILWGKPIGFMGTYVSAVWDLWDSQGSMGLRCGTYGAQAVRSMGAYWDLGGSMGTYVSAVWDRWDSQGSMGLMGCIWDISVYVCLWNDYGITYGLPMGCLWDPYGMSMGCLCDAYGMPMAVGCLLYTYGMLM